jgi:hypothetical protein
VGGRLGVGLYPQSVSDLRSGMTGGARPSATAVGRPRRWAPAGPKPLAGCARGRKKGRWAARRPGLEGRGSGFVFFSFFFQIPISFLKQANNLNSNQDLNPNTQKQCTGMNATVNSYISLID